MPWFECPVIDSNLRLQKHHVCLPSNKMEPKPLIHSNWGSVWIGLILMKLKTYCWNHYSKIISKCVNSTVGPIFNKKIDKKWNLWLREQCTYTLFTKNWSKVAVTVHVPYMNSSRLWGKTHEKKKKKGKNIGMQRLSKHYLSNRRVFRGLCWNGCGIVKWDWWRKIEKVDRGEGW